MKLLLNPIFIVCSLLFLINLALERLVGISIPYFHAYSDDIVCMPVLLTLASVLMQQVNTSNSRHLYPLKKAQILFALAYCIILFELILPHFSKTYTADVWDIPAYTLGAFLFYRFINPAAVKVGTAGN